MKLDVLKKLPWPEYKDVLAFRSSLIKKDALISRGKQQQVSDVNIIFDPGNKDIVLLPNSNFGCNQSSTLLTMILLKLEDYELL